MSKLAVHPGSIFLATDGEEIVWNPVIVPTPDLKWQRVLWMPQRSNQEIRMKEQKPFAAPAPKATEKTGGKRTVKVVGPTPTNKGR